jgi:hypothetical protein
MTSVRVVTFAGGCAIGTLVLLPARAGADQASAEKNFRAGQQAYAQGNDRAAAVAFEAAFRDDPHGSAIYNAALARQLAGDAERAADDFDAALVQHERNVAELTGVQATDARNRLRALEATLGRIDVSAPNGAMVSLPSSEPIRAPARIHVAPGSYSVHIAWPNGQSVDRPVKVGQGQVVALGVTPPDEAPAPSPDARPAPAEEASPSSGHRGWTYAAAGVGGAGIVVGIVTGAMTLADKQTEEKYCGASMNGITRCTNAQGVSAGNQGVTTGLVSTIGFVAGGAGIAAAVILWLTEPRSKPKAEQSAWLPFVAGDGAHEAVVGVRGNF